MSVEEAGREPRATGRGDALLMSYRKSSPPQNRHLNIVISKQRVVDLEGELTF